ncbi:hypothetical protein Ciccas_005447 [Cichlidogyrus casuarinus]|uniref:Uncharacterized protein n=1 Tax=Cichlidogyrus casuarinus TaxID=1844966 RepID=A0ABD2QAX7_9PLAT
MERHAATTDGREDFPLDDPVEGIAALLRPRLHSSPVSGILDVYSVDRNGKESYCNSVNPQETAMLNKLVLFCDGDQHNIDPVALKLRWRQVSEQGTAKYHWKVTGGSVRVSDTVPEDSTQNFSKQPLTTTPSAISEEELPPQPTTTSTTTTTTSTTTTSTTTTTTTTPPPRRRRPRPTTTTSEDNAMWSVLAWNGVNIVSSLTSLYIEPFSETDN